MVSWGLCITYYLKYLNSTEAIVSVFTLHPKSTYMYQITRSAHNVDLHLVSLLFLSTS